MGKEILYLPSLEKEPTTRSWPGDQDESKALVRKLRVPRNKYCRDSCEA